MNGTLVPVVELKSLEKHLKEKHGSGSFKIAKSVNKDSFTLEYVMNGDILGMAELPSWRNDEAKEVYLILLPNNIMGSVDVFVSLFQEIAGKIMGSEKFLPFFTLFSQ